MAQIYCRISRQKTHKGAEICCFGRMGLGSPRLNEKNLIIQDRKAAEEYLRKIGYFALISGYKDAFKNKTTKKFSDGTNFNEIVALYEFDERLREIFLRYLLKIEQYMRSLMSYYFTEKFGSEQSKYLDKNNYDYVPKNIYEINKLINLLNEYANKTVKYEYISHSRRKYSNVPLWVLIKAMTFGKISKMYMYFTPSIKSAISKNISGVNEKELARYLSVLSKFRNVCAHGERLFSYKIKETICDTPEHDDLKILKKNGQYVYGKHDLFAVVIAFKYLLCNSDFAEFLCSLEKCMNEFSTKNSHIDKLELCRRMGFPCNWLAI